MYTCKLGVYTSLALVANAILVPPNLVAENLGDDIGMETLAINPFKRTVALECPGCAYASVEGSSLSWKQDAGNSFLLDFEVGAHDETLDIDDVTLYPPKFGQFSEPFYVTQVDPQRESEDATRLRVTGYTFHYNSAETVTEAGTELLPMSFRITSIESMPFDLPALTINLLKDVDGHLMIASFQTAKTSGSSPIDQDKECNEWPLLCKWKSILADKFDRMKNPAGKGCHKHQGNPMEQEGTHGKPPHVFRPGQPHPHHRPHHHAHGHHHHAHHRLHMFFRRAFFTIFIPIFVGILAGTLTYVIGMALGCVIAIVVAKVRGRSPYERIELEEESEEEESDHDDYGVEKGDEGHLYADFPNYGSPPAYDAAAEREVAPETK